MYSNGMGERGREREREGERKRERERELEYVHTSRIGIEGRRKMRDAGVPEREGETNGEGEK